MKQAVEPDRGDLQRAMSITDLLLKWLQIAAILAAGAWAYYQFFLRGSDNWMINLGLTTEVVPYGKDLRLLVIHVKSKNPRDSEIDIDKSNGSFTLTVRKVPEALAAKTTITTDNGELLATCDIMKRYDGGYVFLPNAEFDDAVGVVLPVGATVAIQARLTRGDDEVTADRFIQVQ